MWLKNFSGPHISYVCIVHETEIAEPGKLYSQHVLELLISLLSWFCFSVRVQSYQIQVFCGCNKILLQWTKRNVHINQHEVDLVAFSHVSVPLWRQASLWKCVRFPESRAEGNLCFREGCLLSRGSCVRIRCTENSCHSAAPASLFTEELGPCLQGQPLRHEPKGSLKNQECIACIQNSRTLSVSREWGT